ncbi:ankyrin-1-like [Phoenix dactylifera]|uniref:Ankyrin-1-like n=1 Tax=Phoenix dactylifera TaxID=42345 RepID=A0A8B9A9N4_PHODC|nr:ankyrin-1-like [Phoenix dactylifera]
MVSLIIQLASEGEIEERRVVRARNRNQANALHEAAKYNHASVAKVLMEEDAGLASMPNSVGMSLLYLAIVTGSLDVAKALLWSSSWENASPASYACRDFSSGASVGGITITVPKNAPTQEDTGSLLGVPLEGNTVLHIVASRGHLDIAEEICRREVSLLATPNMRLDTLLHCAAKAGDDKMVSLIIQFASEGEIEKRRVLRARNRKEANALHEAAIYNHASVAKVLMEEDAGLASMPNSVGMSPLYLAIVTGSLDVAKALLRDVVKEKLTGDDKYKDFRRQANFAKNRGIASVLIATVTFAAGFTVPGGYVADDHPGRGTAVLAKEYAFKHYEDGDRRSHTMNSFSFKDDYVVQIACNLRNRIQKQVPQVEQKEKSRRYFWMPIYKCTQKVSKAYEC